MTLFAGKLPKTVTEDELFESFQDYGLVSVSLKQGFAFLQFESDEKAAHALKEMDGFVWKGQSICLEHASNSIAASFAGKKQATGSQPAVDF